MKPVIFDIDGVLADFCEGFTRIGNKLFGTRVVDTANHPTWNDLGGMIKEEQRAVWAHVLQSPNFWFDLPSLVSPKTWDAISALTYVAPVYFVTNREGFRAKEQTEEWLGDRLGFKPTVVLSKYKGEMAKAIRAGFAIEDKAANASCIAWITEDKTKSYLIDRPYNRCPAGFLASSVVRVNSVPEFLTAIQEGE